MLTRNMPKQLPVALWGMLGALCVAVVVATPVMAAEPKGALLLPDAAESIQLEGPFALPELGDNIPVQGPRQVFRDDLTIRGGQVIEDDVFVYSGDVDIEDGGRITGNLVVFSGNIEIDEESAVEGNITSYSGNITVGGHVGGDLAAMGGNVELASSARIDGDISVVSGNIEREAGATVGGNVVQGPGFRLPGGFAPDAPDGPVQPGINFGDTTPSFFGSLLRFIGRLFTAALTTALMMLLVGGLFYLRPQMVADTRKQLQEQAALSAVVGAAANLVGLFLAGLLAVTICLLPLALVPLLLLAAVNVAGWAVASQIAGERIVKAVKQEVQPALTILVGALFLTGISALLWAFGGCFRFIAFLLIFAISSLGTGAVLLPWINKRRGFGGAGKGGNVPPSGTPPSGPTSGAGMSYDVPVETDVAAPMDYMTAREINDGQRAGGGVSPSAAASSAPERVEEVEVVEHDLAAPIDYMTAEEINSTAEQPAAKPSKARSRVSKTERSEVAPSEGSAEDNVEQDVSQPIDYLTAQEVVTAETVGEGDDFLRIKGIGPTYARRLKDAGYATFAQLAVASPEQVAEAMGWPVDRVRRSEVIDQAKVLAQR